MTSLRNPTPYTQLPTDAPTRARILFFGSRVRRFVRDPSRHVKTPTWNFYREIYEQRWYKNRLIIAFFEESCKEYLKHLCKQTPLWPVLMRKSFRKPEEHADHRKRDIEQSAPTHAHHTHCTSSQLGTTANRKCDVPWDWLWEACHMARVCWENRCGGFCRFCSKEVLHCQIEWSTRNHLERNQVQGAWEVVQQLSSDKQQSTLFTSSEIPLGFLSRAVLHWLSGGLCHARKCQFEDLGEKKRYDLQSPNGCLHEKPSERKAEWGKNAGTNFGTRFPRVSYFKKMRNVCQKYGGTCKM